MLAYNERRSQEGFSKALKVGNFGKQGKTKGGDNGNKKGNGNTKPKCLYCQGPYTKEKCWYLHSNLRPD